jgi:hypothetical protein
MRQRARVRIAPVRGLEKASDCLHLVFQAYRIGSIE